MFLFLFFLTIPSPLWHILPTGDADAAEEERAVHRGSVPEAVQQQEHEGHQGAAQQWPGGGPGGPASCSAGWPT